jgi:hypothetical protein
MKPGFDSWMRQVDAWCQRLCGLSIHDLADCCFADWYEDGASPKAAAKRAIRREQGED